jgi:peptidoglycan-associated lipoprotein
MMVQSASLKTVAGLASIAVLTAGCGIKRGDLDTELATVREEIQQGDQQVEQQLSGRIENVSGDVASLNERMRGFEQQLESLRSEFEGRITQIEAAIRFDVPVHFGYDSHDLRPEDQPVLERFASVVNEYYPSATITVEGFTDPAGDEQYNIWLGEQRASAVREYLVQQGIGTDRIRAVSYGEAQNRQVNPGAWGDNGLMNRRVAFVIDYVADRSQMMVSNN